MDTDIDVFLKDKINEITTLKTGETYLEELYKDINKEELRILFAIIHQVLNELINHLYAKFKSNKHYNAEQSRKLMYIIELLKEMQYIFKNTDYSFKLNEDYKIILEECDEFLLNSGGSRIPETIHEFKILKYAPIFKLNEVVEVETFNKTEKYIKKLIGEGSYAKVFKYKDEFYDRNIVIKRAKIEELDEKEIERFILEFKTMKDLNSPYIIQVYGYDSSKYEYYMECADYTIYDYIKNNNSELSFIQRKNLVIQVLKGLEYLEYKEILHRDISLTNVMVFVYEDTVAVKLSDFGLVKIKESNLTDTNTEIKGSLNDSNLAMTGYKDYNIYYETFAATRVILYIMTGKTNTSNIKNKNIINFMDEGLHSVVEKRFNSIAALRKSFLENFRNNTN